MLDRSEIMGKINSVPSITFAALTYNFHQTSVRLDVTIGPKMLDPEYRLWHDNIQKEFGYDKHYIVRSYISTIDTIINIHAKVRKDHSKIVKNLDYMTAYKRLASIPNFVVEVLNEQIGENSLVVKVLLDTIGPPRWTGWRYNQLVIDTFDIELAIDKYLELRNEVQIEKRYKLGKLLKEAIDTMLEAKRLLPG